MLDVLTMIMSLQSLRKIGKEKLILMLSLTVFLSYLPEAGEYASFFVYLRLVSSRHICYIITILIIYICIYTQ